MLKQELLEAYVSRHATFEAEVSHRVKSPSSLAGKLARPDKIYERLEDITDLVGLRVITFFEDSTEQVGRLIEEHFRFDTDRSEDKKLRQGMHSFGYRSLHYICHPPRELLQHHAGWNWPFEIQIRTILQHAWAEIEHDLGYKSPESVPPHIQRRFSRLAGLLELDTVSLQSLAEASPVSELDTALAARLGKPVESALFYPEYVTRMLRTVQLGRTAPILKSLEAFGPRMPVFAERYFRFTTEAWRFGGERIESVKRGYSLVLLSHWQALRQAELELHRVERMKGFYQQLDYPKDEAEALRVARLFVKCFADWKDPSPR